MYAGCRIDERFAYRLQQMWKRYFHDTKSSLERGIFTLTSRIECEPLLVNGIPSKSTLVNNGIYSLEFSEGKYINLFEVPVPDLRGDFGKKDAYHHCTTVQFYIDELKNQGLNVTGVSRNWNCVEDPYSSHLVYNVYHKKINMDPILFCRATINSLNKVIRLINFRITKILECGCRYMCRCNSEINNNSSKIITVKKKRKIKNNKKSKKINKCNCSGKCRCGYRICVCVEKCKCGGIRECGCGKRCKCNKKCKGDIFDFPRIDCEIDNRAAYPSPSINCGYDDNCIDNIVFGTTCRCDQIPCVCMFDDDYFDEFNRAKMNRGRCNNVKCDCHQRSVFGTPALCGYSSYDNLNSRNLLAW